LAVTQDLHELASRARQLRVIGQLHAARENWIAILSLLPADAPERNAVQREIASIDAQLAPKPKRDWKKRLGPVGVALAAIVKYGSIILTKGKFLISILAFVGVYWAMFGWWFAVGLTASILLHEMGHYLAVRRFGFSAELPMFLPGFGAFVKWRGANVDDSIRAQIALAGPLFGLLSGLISYGIFLLTGHGVWLAVAQFAGWINLLNLIPVFIFDGAPAMAALGAQARWAVLLVCVVLFFTLKEFLFLLVAAGVAYRLWRRDFPAQPRQGIAYYFLAMVVGNGFLSWYALDQARTVFHQ
jgi:Zn-dependent protease